MFGRMKLRRRLVRDDESDERRGDVNEALIHLGMATLRVRRTAHP